MADNVLFEHEQILELHRAAVSAQLVQSRLGLLAGIDIQFVAQLPHTSIPGDQILLDLSTMNEAGALSDGSVPLTLWLRNAIALSGSRKEAAVFKGALNRRWPRPLRERNDVDPAPPHGAPDMQSTDDEPAASSQWVMYSSSAGPVMVVLITIGLLTNPTLDLGSLLAQQSPLLVALVEVISLALALMTLRSFVKLEEQSVLSSLVAFASGCLLWALLVELRPIAQAARAGQWDLFWTALSQDYKWATKLIVFWPIGFLLGAALLWSLRMYPRAAAQRPLD